MRKALRCAGGGHTFQPSTALVTLKHLAHPCASKNTPNPFSVLILCFSSALYRCLPLFLFQFFTFQFFKVMQCFTAGQRKPHIRRL